MSEVSESEFINAHWSQILEENQESDCYYKIYSSSDKWEYFIGWNISKSIPPYYQYFKNDILFVSTFEKVFIFEKSKGLASMFYCIDSISSVKKINNYYFLSGDFCIYQISSESSAITKIHLIPDTVIDFEVVNGKLIVETLDFGSVSFLV